MPSHHSEHFDDLPDTPYSRQLYRGFITLRFVDNLEREYRQNLSLTDPYAHRIAIVLALAIWFMFAVIDIFDYDLMAGLGDRPTELWLLLSLRWFVLGMLMLAFVLIFTNRPGHSHPPLAALTLLLVGGGSTISLILHHRLGANHAVSVQLLVIIACFFPIGLVFYQSVTAALSICLLSLVGGQLFIEDANAPFRQQIPVLFLTVLVGGIGGYIREHTRRTQFLLRQLLDWQAACDTLTGLHNRRSFNRHLATCLQQARRDGIGIALLLIDIDHFKLFNDWYGHPRGDAALRQVAQILQGEANRPMDMAVRLGGEEFALLLYGVDAERTRTVANQLRQAVEQANIPHEASPTSTFLSISIGALPCAAAETPEALYRKADELLYQAKHNGRNQVASPAEDPAAQQ